ncbi:hypothetical protein GPECTOR_40g609 [Gonium pectorale]|uniref:Peptidase S8/S53 domain-containing protein n=1 Tax=Gonium pectorale TaxID=33097 RepID=A0A150GBD0_GONPE|nr:hypothetical protein GPECTOR_40g609 [Gonium pectorale]|eukprot:KXZ46875.1 hypothetical protein GPECTOR_40g609 [Gonium pectorale]
MHPVRMPTSFPFPAASASPSGIVAAARNKFGVVGIAPKVKVMCLKASVAASDSGAFFTSHILKAYDYALRMGAHVVSCSFGPSQPNPTPSPAEMEAMWTEARLYRTALEPLVKKNMLIVAAAGNEHFTLDRLDAVNATYNPCFMARVFPDNMLCVLATDQEDKGWYEIASNIVFGTNNSTKYVDIGAPGRQILSTVPPLQENGRAYYDIKTGSSMATPMVAGVGALILSILGAGSANYYQGAAARRILLESATVLPNLGTRSSSRLNASAALRQARAALSGMKVLTPLPGFLESNQSVMAAGFNETYYAGDIGLDDQDFSRLAVFDTSARTGVSRFESYKYGAGYTLVVRSSIKFAQSGIYTISVTTTASAADLVVKLGQSTIAPVNTRIPLTVDAGWYEFQVRYRNPSAVVDVKLADPGGGGSPSDYKYPSTFFTVTPVPPRQLYYAPNIALSSAFQVLTRPASGPIRRNSILDGPFPTGLQLDQPYNFSSVVEDVGFDGGAALRDALYPPASGISPPPASIVGMVHTRIRIPETPMRFRDIFTTLVPTSLASSDLAQLYMRCYTYINRGFANGAAQSRSSSSNTIYTFLGSQSVFRADTSVDLRGPYNLASVAPNRTSMAGYYQLLAAGACRQRVRVGAAGAPGSGGRGLLQASPSSSGYNPIALGSSAYDARQVGSAGLTAAFFRPNPAAPAEAIPGLSGLVANNLTGLTVLGVVTAAGGLTGSTTGPAAAAGTTRYTRADGFLRSPTPDRGDGAMAAYVLRVRDGDGQAVSVTMGNVTVRNGVEFPARAVAETRTELMLPAGYVPTVVTVRSSRPDAAMVLDVGLAASGGGAEQPIDRSLWFANTDSTVGK